MSGFWAGAVPPWAYAVGACLFILAVLLGAWYGYGRGFKHAEEEISWAREQAKARRTHPVYRQPPEIAHEDFTFADGPVGEYLAARMVPMPDPITTGEIQAITDEMDAWLAQHVYAAPKDYGQWLEMNQ